MHNSIHLFANVAMLAVAERKTLGGQEHLVVPVVAIKEGVLNNILYTSEEIQIFAEAWNGVPVPVNHPVLNGTPVSANSTLYEETTNVGRFYGAYFDKTSNSLKGEIWINIAKAEVLQFGGIIERLERGEILEVSTGLYSRIEKESGEFNGKSYSARATGIRPDHLAILPDTVGACSIEDGCGAMRTNCAEETSCSCKTKTMKTNKDKQKLWDRAITALGFKTNEVSHETTRDILRNHLQSFIPKDSYAYIVQVFKTNFIYEVGDLLYRRNYTLDESTGQVLLFGDEEQVVAHTNYTPTTMQNNNVKSFLANAGTEITAEERSALEAMDQTLLSKILANAQKATSAPQEPTIEKVVAANEVLTSDDRELLKLLRANEVSRVAELREKVAAGYPNLTKEVVANMDAKAIEALAGGIAHNVSRAPAGGAPVTNNSGEDEIYVPVDVFEEMCK